MDIDVITIFPPMFAAITDYGITAQALKKGIYNLYCWNPRDFTKDMHRTVDDRPYGGGPGMVMMAEPLARAIEAAKARQKDQGLSKPTVVYLSPQGRKLDQALAENLAKLDSLILLCGRYEGIDQRLIDTEVTAEISIGDYVLSGGEIAAMVLLDVIIRLLPGALGDEKSAKEESFSEGYLDWPHYTRPRFFRGLEVPEILLSGHAEKIAQWRRKKALEQTLRKRPDLLDAKETT